MYTLKIATSHLEGLLFFQINNKMYKRLFRSMQFLCVKDASITTTKIQSPTTFIKISKFNYEK